MNCITKQSLHEIKMFPSPPKGVDSIVISIADFIEGKQGSYTWAQAKGKLFELFKKGVCIREQCTEDQLTVLRAFAETGITYDSIKPKSSAAANLANYLHAMIALQEHFYAQPEELSEAFW